MIVAIDKRRIFVVSLAHMFNDWYMNHIQTLLPFLIAAGMSISKGAFLVSAFTVSSSLLQPIFGYYVDKRNQHWLIYAGTLWMAVFINLVGVCKSYVCLLLIVCLSGIGTAAFHPQASMIVTELSGNRKGVFQAFFLAAGNVGWALNPLMVVPFIQTYGMETTPVFVLPGVLVAMLLLFTIPKVPLGAKAAYPGLAPVLRLLWTNLNMVMVVVVIRSLAYFGLVAFLPLYLEYKHISLLTASRLMFVMLFAGAMGGLIGGYLSDLFGRKSIIIASLILASPLFYLFLNTSNPWSYLFIVLAGASLLASFSVTVVLAQELISENAAMAAGLMLGFSIGVGGLGVGIMGIIAEYIGIIHVIDILIWLPCIAGLVGCYIKEAKKTAPSFKHF